MKYSIVIPVYNIAPYIRECLDSVFAQAFASWEAICVDDGSTDGSGKILDEYAKTDCRFRVIHKENGGVGAARNVGLDAVAGEWVLFLDGDDVLHPNALQHIAEIIMDHVELDAIQFCLKRFGDKEVCAWDPVANNGCEIRDISKTFAGTPTYNFTCIAYRAALLKHVRFGDQIIGEDVLFLALFMDVAKKICKIKDELYGYRVRFGSAMEAVISIRKVCDKLDSAKSILNVYIGSQKFIPDSYWRTQCNALTETMPYEWKYLDRRNRELIRQEWKICLRGLLAKDGGKIPARQRIRMRVVLILPELLVPLLCQFPYWLKAKGFHR